MEVVLGTRETLARTIFFSFCEAWRRVKGNRGSGDVDGITIDHIVKEYGEERFVEEIRKQLIAGTYHPLPARRKEIPKPDGKLRPAIASCKWQQSW